MPFVNRFLLKKIISSGLLLLFSIFGCNEALSNVDSNCSEPTFKGINIAGAEFSSNKIPGKSGIDYRFPTLDQLTYYKKLGFNSIRLPLLWERLQPYYFSPLDERYSKELLDFMYKANQVRLPVVIDLHNYARYKSQLIGSDSDSKLAFEDLWRKVALLLKEEQALYAYGLMNEPHDTNGTWHDLAQYGVNGIRSIDKNHYIYISGDSWSGASSWPKVNPEPFVSDPQNKIFYEAHVYFDDDFSGRYLSSNTYVDQQKRVYERVSPFILWLKKFNQKGVIGEWGVPTATSSYKDTVDSFVSLTGRECIDWFIWAGGVWSSGYKLAIPPFDEELRPIIKYLNIKN